MWRVSRLGEGAAASEVDKGCCLGVVISGSDGTVRRAGRLVGLISYGVNAKACDSSYFHIMSHVLLCLKKSATF